MSDPLTRGMRTPEPPQVRSREFRKSAVRLLKRLVPQRGLTVAVMVLGIGGIAVGVLGPRILGHARKSVV